MSHTRPLQRRIPSRLLEMIFYKKNHFLSGDANSFIMTELIPYHSTIVVINRSLSLDEMDRVKQSITRLKHDAQIIECGPDGLQSNFNGLCFLFDCNHSVDEQKLFQSIPDSTLIVCGR